MSVALTPNTCMLCYSGYCQKYKGKTPTVLILTQELAGFLIFLTQENQAVCENVAKSFSFSRIVKVNGRKSAII